MFFVSSIQIRYDGVVVNGYAGIYQAFELVAEDSLDAQCLRRNAQQFTTGDAIVCVQVVRAL